MIWGLPAALIVAGVLSVGARGGPHWSRSWLVFGDASYSIYLMQMIVIYNVLNRLVQKISRPVGSASVTDLIIVSFVVVSVVVGMALNVMVEVPLRYHLRLWHERAKMLLAPSLVP